MDIQQKKPLLPEPPAIETKKLLSVLIRLVLLVGCIIFQRLYGSVSALPSADVPIPEETPLCWCSPGQEEDSRYLTCCIRRSLRLQRIGFSRRQQAGLFMLLSTSGHEIQWNTPIADKLVQHCLNN